MSLVPPRLPRPRLEAIDAVRLQPGRTVAKAARRPALKNMDVAVAKRLMIYKKSGRAMRLPLRSTFSPVGRQGVIRGTRHGCPIASLAGLHMYICTQRN